MNRFSYYITTHFIPSNKNYNSCHNPHSMYQTYPKWQLIKTNVIERIQYAWGVLNRGHKRYLHFCCWLHFKSKVQIVRWRWRTEHTKILKMNTLVQVPWSYTKILKINTPMHVPWSLNTKILKIGTPVLVPWRNMWKKLMVRLKYKGYFTQIFDLFLENKKLFMN